MFFILSLFSLSLGQAKDFNVEGRLTDNGKCLGVDFWYNYVPYLDLIEESGTVNISEVPDPELKNSMMKRITTQKRENIDFWEVKNESEPTYYLLYMGKGRSISLEFADSNHASLTYRRGPNCQHLLKLKAK